MLSHSLSMSSTSLIGRGALLAVGTSSFAPSSTSLQARTIIRIPKHEYDIRFDPTVGRKVSNQNVLDRFKRLNNGLWLKAVPGRGKLRYMKNEPWLTNSLKMYTCSQRDSQILDAMMSPFWLRKKYPIKDEYEFYQTRRNMPRNSPRVDYKGRLTHERRKILLDDTTADKYFSR